MLDLRTVSGFIYENFQQVTASHNGTHFHARCPLCGDSKISATKKRFHLDYKQGRPVWHCFNCGRSGGFISLYCEVLRVSPEEAYKKLYKYDSNRLKNQLIKQPPWPRPVSISKEKEKFNWILDDCAGPGRVVDSIQYNNWIKYLNEFRQDRIIPNSIKLFYAYKGKYQGRIIIPIYEGDDVIYFQGRRKPGTAMEPKYKNPVAEKSMIIHNQENFDPEKHIIVTEGLIDCAMIGKQGTTMLGVEASDLFIKALLKMTNRKIIMAYDNDAPGRKALKKFMRESKYNKRVLYFLMPKEFKHVKDLNELRKININENKIGELYDFVVDNSFSYLKTTSKLILEEKCD